MSLEKIMKSASLKVKENASNMIKNGNNFSCTLVELEYTENDETKYLTISEIEQWMIKLYTKELAYKPYSEKALENMKEKGVTPKKQPGEIVMYTITSTSDAVIIGLYIPPNVFPFEDLLLTWFPYYYSKEDFVFSIIESSSPFKDRDLYLRKAFDSLKEAGIYKYDEEESDDEMYILDD